MDSKPDINLDNSAIARSNIVANLAIDSALEIPAAAEIFLFSAPLYSAEARLSCVRTPVHPPRTATASLGLDRSPQHLKFGQSRDIYALHNPAKAAGKAANFSISAHPSSALVANATVFPTSRPHSLPTPQEPAAVSTLLLPCVDLSMGWVMDSGASRHYCCFEEQLHHINYDTIGWVSGLDVGWDQSHHGTI